MGAAASSSDYVNLNDEQKEIWKIKYENLIHDGKTEDEAINELKQPQLLVKTIELTSLLSECELAVTNGKTPLVIDNSNDSKVDTFFSYRSMPIIDGKKMGLDKSIRKIPVPEIMEEARKKLSLALKIGMPLIIAMTKSVTDFTTTFNDSIAKELYQLNSNDNNAYLPIEMFDHGGKKLLSDKYLDAIIRKGPERNDIGGIAISRNPDGFYLILTSQFSPDDYEEYFFGNEWGLPKPKDKYQVLIISPSSSSDV